MSARGCASTEMTGLVVAERDNSRFPEGMTERKARAKAEADPCGTTARKAKANTNTKARAKAKASARTKARARARTKKKQIPGGNDRKKGKSLRYNNAGTALEGEARGEDVGVVVGVEGGGGYLEA